MYSSCCVVVLGPLARGYDSFYGLTRNAHNHFSKRMRGSADWHLWNGTVLWDAPTDLKIDSQVSSTHEITEYASQKIEEHAESKEPFVMMVAYTMPHDPLMVDTEYMDQSHRGATNCLTRFSNWRRQRYCAMVTCVDESVGNLTRLLKHHHMLHDTIIVFTSDNGGIALVRAVYCVYTV